MSQVDPGNYFAFVQKLEMIEGTKAPALVVDIDVTYKAQDGDWVALPDGPVQRSLYFSFSDAAYEWTEKKLKALGFNGDFKNPRFSDKAMTEGIEVVCDIRPDSKNNARENWDLANWGGQERKTPAQDVRARLQARWATNTEAAKPAAGKPAMPPRPAGPPKAPARAAAAPVNGPQTETIPIDEPDDDIPF